MKDRTARSFGILLLVCVWCLSATHCGAVDKHARVIGLFDVTVHFQDPNFDWQHVSDAFVKQFLVDTATNVCIQPMYLPARILGNPVQQSPFGFEGTAGLDYVAYGDLYKDADGYRMEAYLARGKDHLVVLKYSALSHFTDPREAPWKAQMAALSLRDVEGSTGTSSHSLADLILDFEKKQREDSPEDHAIAPEIKINLAEADRYPLKLKPGEKRDISFSLMDCDGVADKGAVVDLDTITGDVTPEKVNVDTGGNGKFAFTAQKKNADGTIRVGFSYLRGSQHPGNPEYDVIYVHIGADKLAFRTVVDAKIQEAELAHSETHHSESVYAATSPSDPSCTTGMMAGDKCQFTISSLNATATAKFPNGSHTATANKAGNAIEAEIVRLPTGSHVAARRPNFRFHESG